MKRGGKRGFSTLEVLLVLTILLVLSSFFIPAVFKKIEEARNAQAVTTLHNLERVYSLSLSLLQVAPVDGVKTPAAGATVHIPQRAGETASAYAAYMEGQIAYAFNGAPPAYEITLEGAGGEAALSIAYWPLPEKEPTLCYVLSGSTIVRAERTMAGQAIFSGASG